MYDNLLDELIEEGNFREIAKVLPGNCNRCLRGVGLLWEAPLRVKAIKVF